MHCHYASTNTLFRVTRSLLLQRSSCGLRALSSFRSTPPTFMNTESLPYHLVVGLPALSPTMEVGTLAEWYVQAGDSFSAGDALAKIETDKAAMDFEAQDDGVVAKLLVPAGNGADSCVYNCLSLDLLLCASFEMFLLLFIYLFGSPH